MTTAVPATDFCRNFATYQREVQLGPIQVQSHGKTTGYFVSPEQFERVQRILAESRKAYYPSELPEHLRTAIKGARMGAEHAALDRLLDD